MVDDDIQCRKKKSKVLKNIEINVISRAREYVDCIGHIRLLSWLLLGSLTHTSMYAGNNTHNNHGQSIPSAQPIPQEVSCHVADHVQVIFSGFPEQSKASVLHMSSLFHAFILCQVCIYILVEYLNRKYVIRKHYCSYSVMDDVFGRIIKESIE